MSGASRRLWITATVSGFILDLDSSIADYVFSLIDVYREGKERVAKLTASAPRQLDASDSATSNGPTAKPYVSLPTLNILANLTFLSGKIHMYSGFAASTIFRAGSIRSHPHELTDEQLLGYGAELLKLPVLSVWLEYRGAPASQAGREAEPSMLMVKTTIHSSKNTLRPTLLPLFTELISHVESRMRRANRGPSDPPPLASPDLPQSPSISDPAPDVMYGMQISFSLRIDKSKLELTCQPDVNVIAGIHWDSGGFVVTVSPWASQVTFAGSVDGLTLALKHGFLSEDSVRLDARDLAFSVTFAKVDFGPRELVSSASVILDTEFSGVARFSRFQDVLCFKAVWLDRIPVFSGQPTTTPKTPIKPSSLPLSPLAAPKPEFVTAVLVRVRRIKLDVDLGQSISAVTFDLTNAILRTKINEEENVVAIHIAQFSVVGKGNVSGYITVPECVFQTIRRREGSSVEVTGTPKMLELYMTSGTLSAMVESDHQKFLEYRWVGLLIDCYCRADSLAGPNPWKS
jgi:hypothetical protein